MLQRLLATPSRSDYHTKTMMLINKNSFPFLFPAKLRVSFYFRSLKRFREGGVGWGGGTSPRIIITLASSTVLLRGVGGAGCRGHFIFYFQFCLSPGSPAVKQRDYGCERSGGSGNKLVIVNLSNSTRGVQYRLGALQLSATDMLNCSARGGENRGENNRSVL